MTIVKMITDHLIQRLSQVCVTDVPPGDPTRAGYVGRGPVEDPETSRISIIVSPNDPDDRNWAHELDKSRIAMGGPLAWKRRFCVTILCYFTSSGETVEHAEEIAHTVLSRVERAMGDVVWSIGPDALGERVTGGRPLVKSAMERSGGGDGDVVWTGKVWLEFNTGG